MGEPLKPYKTMWLKGEESFASVGLMQDVIFSSLSILELKTFLLTVLQRQKQNVGETYRRRNVSSAI